LGAIRVKGSASEPYGVTSKPSPTFHLRCQIDHYPRFPRRQFLSKSTLGFGAVTLAPPLPAASPKEWATAESYLRSILYRPGEVEAWLRGAAFPFARYSSEFGWLLPNGRFPDGVHDSISVYTYEPDDGPRIRVHYADRPGRINTYGNSYTQCHQVSDGETWQEVLAAHIQEPVRNFGIGGWSVYQAYLRMLKEEDRTPADVIIFNIYDDDHFRNLDSWRNIRVNKHPQFIEPPLPHLVVNPSARTVVEMPNPTPTEDSLFQLCDFDWVFDRFGKDFALQIELAHLNSDSAAPGEGFRDLLRLATTHGIVNRADAYPTLDQAARALHEAAALFATRWIVAKINAYAREQNKQLIYVLSYPADRIGEAVSRGTRWDQPFVDFLKAGDYPVVDLFEAHVRDHAEHYKIPLEPYLRQFFMGHYNPRGNAFCARALRPALVEALDPKPPAYRF
jgi:hypothetical protein